MRPLTATEYRSFQLGYSDGANSFKEVRPDHGRYMSQMITERYRHGYLVGYASATITTLKGK